MWMRLTLRSGSFRAAQRFLRRMLQLSQLRTSEGGAQQRTWRASWRTYTQTDIIHQDNTVSLHWQVKQCCVAFAVGDPITQTNFHFQTPLLLYNYSALFEFTPDGSMIYERNHWWLLSANRLLAFHWLFSHYEILFPIKIHIKPTRNTVNMFRQRKVASATS